MLVSYWPVFSSLSLVTVPEVNAKLTRPSFDLVLRWRMASDEWRMVCVVGVSKEREANFGRASAFLSLPLPSLLNACNAGNGEYRKLSYSNIPTTAKSNGITHTTHLAWPKKKSISWNKLRLNVLAQLKEKRLFKMAKHPQNNKKE